MSDNNMDIGTILSNLSKLAKYDGVTWYDGAKPALSAENLNKSENALKQLLKKFGESDEGAIQQIVDVLDETFKQVTEITGRTSTLETTVDGNDNVVGLVDDVNTLEKNVKTNTDNIEDIKGRVGKNESDIEAINGRVDLNSEHISENANNISSLDTYVKTDIKNLLDAIKTYIEELSDKVVQDNNEVILRCGTSTTVLFDVSE